LAETVFTRDTRLEARDSIRGCHLFLNAVR
jgi:hypothetical protein